MRNCADIQTIYVLLNSENNRLDRRSNSSIMHEHNSNMFCTALVLSRYSPLRPPGLERECLSGSIHHLPSHPPTALCTDFFLYRCHTTASQSPPPVASKLVSVCVRARVSISVCVHGGVGLVQRLWVSLG